MNLLILASLIVFSLTLAYMLKRTKRKEAEAEQSFWERERQANSVRRKSLEHLNYITIPLETLPTSLLSDDPTVAECIELLQNLSGESIVNLTGYSNTDLKLEYGTANITALSEYDQNYTLLVRTLQKWADVLLEHNYPQAAETVMEFAVQTNTDISRTYYKLAELYAAEGKQDKIDNLITTAQALRSANKKAIVRTLQESYR